MTILLITKVKQSFTFQTFGKQIFEYVDKLDKTKKVNYRNRAIIYLLLDTGVRFNELRNLRMKNINFDSRLIRLTETKTKKHRDVIMTPKTAIRVLEYVDKCVITDYLYVSVETGERINRVHFYRFSDRMKKDLNIPKEISISPHKYRHTMATMSLKNGASLEHIRKILGHSSLSITQKYLHLDKEELKKVHDQTSPIHSL